MRILGIDQSYTSSGIVVLDDNGKMIHSEIFKTPKEDDVFVRAEAISDKIVATVKEFAVESVSIEGLAFGSVNANATRDLAGLQFLIVTKVRLGLEIPVSIMAPTSLKKFATGSGKATKKEMIASLPSDVLETFKSSGFKVTTGLADLADAYFLAQKLRNENADSGRGREDQKEIAT